MINDLTRIRDAFAKAAEDHKIDGPEAQDLIAEARRNGLTESKAKELVRETAAYRATFTPEASKAFDTFIKDTMKSVEILDNAPKGKGPAKEPAVVKIDQKRLEWESVPGGKLFTHPPLGNDVEQNYIGDCYLMAAMSAVAKADPKDIEKAFTQNDDGTFTVHLFAHEGGKLVPRDVVIDAELPRNGWYGYYYARARDPKELWPALLEKAFAAMHGSYGAIEGGDPANAIETITGRQAKTLDLRAAGTNPDATFEALAAAVKAGKPATAATLSDASKDKYKGTGIFTDHTYTVWGVSVENGVKYVHLRNPWGDSEPKGNGRDDGIFKIPLKEFMSLYCSVAPELRHSRI